MSAAGGFLHYAALATLVILSLAFAIAVWRVFRGPTLPDRIVALDTLVVVAIGFLAAIGLKTGFSLYMDIAIALGLVGFLATVALARFVLSPQGQAQKASDAADSEAGET